MNRSIQEEDSDSNEVTQTIQFSESFFSSSIIVPVEKLNLSYTSVLPKGLKYAHLNINGIKSKFFDIQRFKKNENNVMACSITESKLGITRDSTKQFELPN